VNWNNQNTFNCKQHRAYSDMYTYYAQQSKYCSASTMFTDSHGNLKTCLSIHVET